MGKKWHKLKLSYLTRELISGSSALEFPNGSKLFNRECPIYGATNGSRLFSNDTSKIVSNILEGIQTIYIPGIGSINYLITVNYDVDINGIAFIPSGKIYVYEIISGTEKFLDIKGTITTLYSAESRDVTIKYCK